MPIWATQKSFRQTVHWKTLLRGLLGAAEIADERWLCLLLSRQVGFFRRHGQGALSLLENIIGLWNERDDKLKSFHLSIAKPLHETV